MTLPARDGGGVEGDSCWRRELQVGKKVSPRINGSATLPGAPGPGRRLNNTKGQGAEPLRGECLVIKIPQAPTLLVFTMGITLYNV
jgi:hypothetical protein